MNGIGPTGMSMTTPIQASTALQMRTPQQSVDTDSLPRQIAADMWTTQQSANTDSLPRRIAADMWTPQQSADTDSLQRRIASEIRVKSSAGHGWGGNWTPSVAADQILFQMSSVATTIPSDTPVLQSCQHANYLVGIDVQSPISVTLSVKILIHCLGFIYSAFWLFHSW